MKAMPISPVRMKAMPKPRNGAGTLEYLIFSRIAAMAMMAMAQPMPEPMLYPVAYAIVYSLATIQRAAPKMA